MSSDVYRLTQGTWDNEILEDLMDDGVLVKVEPVLTIDVMHGVAAATDGDRLIDLPTGRYMIVREP